MSETKGAVSLLEHFADLEDPRREHRAGAQPD